MKDIFSPIFLLCLTLLTIFHHTRAEPSSLPPLAIITFAAAAIIFAFYNRLTGTPINLDSPGEDAKTATGKKNVSTSLPTGSIINPQGSSKTPYYIVYILIALAFALLISYSFLRDKELYYSKQELVFPRDHYISITGKVKEFPEIRQEESVFILAAETLEYEKKIFPCAVNMRLTVKGDLRYLDSGDKINVIAKLYNRQSNLNFYPNPFDHYLLYKKIHFGGYCKSSQLVTVIEKSGFPWTWIGAWRNAVRHAIEKKYQSPQGFLDKKGVLLEAILLGDRGRLENDVEDELLDAGIFHLLAISGAHIGILSVFLLFLLRALGVRYNKRHILTGCFLLVFLAFSGFPLSAQRAVFMALVIFTARIIYAEFEPFNVISFCGLLLLFKNPAEFLAPGFILTFALTATIVAGRRFFLPLLEKTVLKHLHRYLKELISANFSASLISLPLSLFYFKRYSFAGFLAGLLLFPLTFIITAGGFALLVLAPTWQAAAHLLLQVINIPLELFFICAGFFSKTIDLTIYRASPSLFWVLLTLVTFFIFPIIGNMEKGSQKTKKTVIVTTIVLFIFSILWMTFMPVIFPYRPGHLEVFFLDVGQGDSHVVVFPGGEGLLIDGGGTYNPGFQTGKRLVLPFLLQKKIDIRWVAVTHYHPDHARGITEIIDILEPEELWLSAAIEDNEFYRKLVNRPHPIPVKKIAASFMRKVGSCTISCLHPRSFIVANHAENDHSQVLKISDGKHGFLFAGDIEQGVEISLARTGCRELSAQVLKVPHHGSRSSSSLEFLRCVSPCLAIYPVAKGNRFGFPHEQVVKNYKSLDIITLSTADRGGICVASLDSGLVIETSR